MKLLFLFSRSRLVAAAMAFLMIGVISFQATGDDTQKKKEEEWKAPARAAKKKNPIPADKESIAFGKKIYEKECLSCHGVKGKGDGPAVKDLEKNPGNLSDPKMWDQTDGALFWKTTEGKKPMPGYEKLLREEDRWHVVNYMRTLAPKPKENPKSKEK